MGVKRKLKGSGRRQNSKGIQGPIVRGCEYLVEDSFKDDLKFRWITVSSYCVYYSKMCTARCFLEKITQLIEKD